MDLLRIAQKLWRYKLITIPITALTMLGAVYVVAVKKPTYEASSSYILLNPPPPPTEEEVRQDPALREIDPHNPYTGYDDLTVVIEAAATTLEKDAAQQALSEAGADGEYTVTPRLEGGFSKPIVDITAAAPTPEVAIQTAGAVGRRFIVELEQMQRDEGVESRYLITASRVEVADQAELVTSDVLRMLAALLALAAVLLFVAISIADAVTTLRMERMGRPPAPRRPAFDEPSAQAEPVERESNPGAQEGAGLSAASTGTGGPVELVPDPHPEAPATTNGRRPGRVRHQEQEGQSSS